MKRYLLKENKVWFLLAIVFKLLQNIAALGVAVILSVLIDTINKQDINLIKKQVLLSVGYAMFVGVVTLLSMRIEAKYRKNALTILRKDVMNGILKRNIVSFQKENSAKYISMLHNNLSVIEENYFKNIIQIFGSITMIVLAVALLLFFNWMIAIVAILLSIIPSVIPMLFAKKLGDAQKEIATSSTNYTSKIKDIFNGFEVIKSYGISKRVKVEHDGMVTSFEQKKCSNGYLMANLYGITNFASISVQFMIILFAGVLAVNGYITLGNIIAITQLTGQAISPAFALSSKLGLFTSVKAINKELLCFIDTNEETNTSIKNKAMNLKESILFDQVSFSYDGDRNTLDGISQTFEKNKKYAIVGASGCGKSTLLKLLLHYYNNYIGELMVDHNSYKEYDAENINTLCSFLQQSVFLFDDTIENNITLFETASKERIDAVILKAGLKTFIEKLPKGIKTSVGECGNLLSGGERQRIAIARALLKGSDVLILDEATSALDNETASYIENTILDMKDVTGIIVTHRLHKNALMKYDELIVMDNGKIIQTGKFTQLLQSCTLFQKLYYANV